MRVPRSIHPMGVKNNFEAMMLWRRKMMNVRNMVKLDRKQDSICPCGSTWALIKIIVSLFVTTNIYIDICIMYVVKNDSINLVCILSTPCMNWHHDVMTCIILYNFASCYTSLNDIQMVYYDVSKVRTLFISRIYDRKKLLVITIFFPM